MEELKTGFYYHIFNRGINSSDIFFTDKDYVRFLDRIIYYLYPAAEIYAYCLLRNHFHLLIRIRTYEEQAELYNLLKENPPEKELYGVKFNHFKPYRTSWQIGHLLNSHTKYINTSLIRTGDLFEGRFKRKVIDSNFYLSQIICYIHRNPIHHKISKCYDEYLYSSFNQLVTGTAAFLEKNKVFDIFGTKENFISAHDEFKGLLGDDYWLE
jgi:putative transposase